MEPGVDYEGDDPVGVDEEWRYFRKVPEIGSNEKVQQEKKKKKSSKNVTGATDSECGWKVHAKKLLGCPTFMVY
jgi:hypothetical protein